MGYRMSIYPAGNESNSVGDDHKFYGYALFDAVKNSFTYLYSFMRKQDPFIYDFDDVEEAYDFICGIPFGPTICLSEEEYETFMALYLTDITNHWCKLYPDYAEDVERIRGYMTDMKNTPGSKVITFG